MDKNPTLVLMEQDQENNQAKGDTVLNNSAIQSDRLDSDNSGI
ncbi:2722_t:CDS:2 [Acaulospora colombiana]|uniref:2722_t:CDS:1 n=1 Tax=Acaulospora colombiana TaxID=27376 RepID=A0ACA9LGR5_9GLOM|nr:2722_t:CDS:2 [Acaulospora colombiana]